MVEPGGLSVSTIAPVLRPPAMPPAAGPAATAGRQKGRGLPEGDNWHDHGNRLVTGSQDLWRIMRSGGDREIHDHPHTTITTT